MEFGAFLTGPSAAAARTRGASADGLARLRERGERQGMSTEPTDEWSYAHRRALRIAAVGVIALIFVSWCPPPCWS